MDEFFEEKGYPETIDKKNARILFRKKYGIIEDLIVASFENPDDNDYLYSTYNLDIGNCLSDWDEWTLTDVLMATFVSYDIPTKLRKKVLFELSKIKEFRSELFIWIYKNWGS